MPCWQAVGTATIKLNAVIYDASYTAIRLCRYHNVHDVVRLFLSNLPYNKLAALDCYTMLYFVPSLYVDSCLYIACCEFYLLLIVHIFGTYSYWYPFHCQHKNSKVGTVLSQLEAQSPCA
jgi:hypothetical protein